ncbi:MAG: tyrosine-type recombinase/integrase [Bryobacterales bacterium]|nr:tyrosine-type recombinase/integrase [Bryobacterales bacterium]
MTAVTAAARAESVESVTQAVLEALASPHSRRAYAKALADFLAWSAGRGPLHKPLVVAYRAHLQQSGLSAATVNLRLAAVRKLAAEAADRGWLSGEAAAAVGTVKGARRLGVRAGNWLDRSQAEQLLALPDTSTPRGKRDRALLALLIGCGLRRAEAVSLTPAHLQWRDGRWVILDLAGKHGRLRSVPMPAWAKLAVDEWTAVAPPDGPAAPLFRALDRAGNPARSAALTPQSLYDTVAAYAARLTTPVAPHDLRRTFGKLAHQGGAPIEQIQLSYGHASLTTTERYLGVRQDFVDAPCDRLGLWEPEKAKRKAV